MFPTLSSLWNVHTDRVKFSSQLGEGDLPLRSAICDLDSGTDKRTRTLRHLLKLFHSEYSPVNTATGKVDETSKLLVAAYDVGLTIQQFDELFERRMQGATGWQQSPSEVTRLDWKYRDPRLTLTRYQRAFLDFFEDEVVESAYDWLSVLNKYLFSDGSILVRRAFCSDGAPLVHLANAIMCNSCEMATEALVLFCVCSSTEWSQTPFDDANDPHVYGDKSIGEILNVARDEYGGKRNLELEDQHRLKVLWSLLREEDFTAVYDDLQLLALRILACDTRSSPAPLQLVSVGCALRVIWPVLHPDTSKALLLQWWWCLLNEYVKGGCSLPRERKGRQEGGNSQSSWKHLESLIQRSEIEKISAILPALQVVREGARGDNLSNQYFEIGSLLLSKVEIATN